MKKTLHNDRLISITITLLVLVIGVICYLINPDLVVGMYRGKTLSLASTWANASIDGYRGN